MLYEGSGETFLFRDIPAVFKFRPEFRYECSEGSCSLESEPFLNWALKEGPGPSKDPGCVPGFPRAQEYLDLGFTMNQTQIVSMHGHAQIPVLVLVGNAHRVWSKSYWSERLLLTSVGFGSGPCKSVSMKRMHLLWPWFCKVFEHAHSVSTCVRSRWYTHVYCYAKTWIALWTGALRILHPVQVGWGFFLW